MGQAELNPPGGEEFNEPGHISRTVDTLARPITHKL